MKEAINTLLQQFAAASTGAKTALVGVVLGLMAATGVAVHYSTQPHYSMLLSGLDDTEAARVGEALAGADVEWRTSQPPGPFVIYVDEAQRTAALNAIASAGAMKPTSTGILTETGGLATLLLGSQEREQIMRKRVWEEMERMLELQDFVLDAKVQTLVPEARVFGRQPDLSASVTLVTRGGEVLTRSQAKTIARLVHFGLGVSEENLMIADDSGQSVYDGRDLANGNGAANDWLSVTEEADRRLEGKASSVLEDILGEGLARVSVKSEWDFTTSRTLADTAAPEDPQLLSEITTKTSDPRFSNQNALGGGVAGTSSNLNSAGEFGVNSQGVVDATSTRSGGANTEPAVAETSQQNRVYAPSRQLRATEQRTPRLDRLSVALFIDGKIDAVSVPAIEEAVKATVGFDAERGDEFRVAQLPFAKKPEGEDADATSDESETLPHIVEMLLERGVEVVLATVFLFMLFRSARGASKARKQREREFLEKREAELQAQTERAEQRARAAEEEENRKREIEEDPAHQSKRRVSDLVGEEPEKVADLLTAWVREDRGVGAR